MESKLPNLDLLNDKEIESLILTLTKTREDAINKLGKPLNEEDQIKYVDIASNCGHDIIEIRYYLDKKRLKIK
jgi:hypothetical protein